MQYKMNTLQKSNKTETKKHKIRFLKTVNLTA